MKLFYTDRARDDIELALLWYERQRRGLGFDFLDCVEVALQSVTRNPEMCQMHYLNFRGYVIKKFPFTIFYTVEINEIVVHSVFNNRQNPRRRPH